MSTIVRTFQIKSILFRSTLSDISVRGWRHKAETFCSLCGRGLYVCDVDVVVALGVALLNDVAEQRRAPVALRRVPRDRDGVRRRLDGAKVPHRLRLL